MPEWMFDWIEFRQWGWNTSTGIFIAILVVTVAEAWGVYRQAKTIWKNPEAHGESVSVGMFSYLAAMFFISAIFGWYKNIFAMVFTGILLGALHVPIIVGLWKFKGFRRWEKLLGLLSAEVIIGTFFTPDLDVYFLIINIGTVILLLLQPYEIWKNKNSGVVEIRLLTVYLAGTGFWVVYSFCAVDELALKIINPIFFAIILFTTLLWFKYRKPAAKTWPVLHNEPI